MLYFGGINDKSTHIGSNSSVEASYKADETPIQSDTGIENMGLAVFKGDKIVRRTYKS